MKTYDEHLKEFINRYLKTEYHGPYREDMINAFNNGFSAGASWMLDNNKDLLEKIKIK